MQGLLFLWVYRLHMKHNSLILFLLTAVLVAGCGKTSYPIDNSSDGRGNGPYPLKEEYDALVTVKQTQGKVYFQVDGETCVYPASGYSIAYDGPKRLACGLKVFDYQPFYGWWQAQVTWYEELEKGRAFLKDAHQGNKLNTESLDVLDDGLTTLEDGFLTLHYSAWWGNSGIPHSMELVGLDPYYWLVIYKSNGDPPLRKADALIYFDLNDVIPHTEGTAITLRFYCLDDYSVEKTFWFRSRSE